MEVEEFAVNRGSGLRVQGSEGITRPKNGTQGNPVEKIPNEILSEICDIISGFTEIEETEN